MPTTRRTSERTGRTDPRDLPCYPLAEAAHYLGLAPSTLRSWVRGARYTHAGEARHSAALIHLPDSSTPALSFFNLVEAHVLKAIRRRHGVSMPVVRAALDWVEKELPVAHPLANHRFRTDGARLFVEAFGRLVDPSRGAQIVSAELLAHYLERVEHDEDGLAARLFPFTRRSEHGAPRLIVIDPSVAFGRPSIRGTAIPTRTIAERYKAGDSLPELAKDYGCEPSWIEEALRCEIDLPAAA